MASLVCSQGSSLSSGVIAASRATQTALHIPTPTVEYDSDTKELILKDKSGTVLYKFPIDSFISDSLINDNGYLKNKQMGTNFYLRRKIPDSKIYELCNLMWDGEYERVRDFLNDDKNLDIHLGKRSYGWRFLWDHNNFKYFEPTLESFTEFLKSGSVIVNEYGEKFTLEQFLEDEIKHNLENGITLRDYYIKENGEDYLRSFELEREREYRLKELYEELDSRKIPRDLISPDETGEFCIGDYRFSSQTGFS